MTSIAQSSRIVPRSFSRPSFGRLTELELRKAIDTRSGFWLLVAALVLAAVAAVARASTGSSDLHDFHSILQLAVLPTSVLLPVVGILLVTSEWSQRTALTTFALVPQRLRVVAAKVAAGSLIRLSFLLIVAAISAMVVAAISDAPDRWAFSLQLSVQFVVYVWIGMMMGIAFGAMTLASAPAIVMYFAAPTVTAILTEFKALEPALKWIDPGTATDALTASAISTSDVQHLLSVGFIWIVVPMTIGLWRIGRAEID